MFGYSIYLYIFVADNINIKSNQKRKAMKNTTLTQIQGDQVNTLLDLVTDQIRTQRVYLRSTPLKNANIRLLTHLRNIKKQLTRQEKEQMRAEAVEMQEAAEALELCAMFNR